MNFIFPYIGNNNDFHIFQRGGYTTSQYSNFGVLLNCRNECPPAIKQAMRVLPLFTSMILHPLIGDVPTCYVIMPIAITMLAIIS